MNKFKLYYNKKEQWQFAFSIVVYLIFAGFTLNLAFSQSSLIESIPFFAILVIFLGTSLWNDYLKFLFKSAIYTLTIACDPHEAIKTVNLLIKKDIFKSYQLSAFMLKCLSYLDMNAFNETITYVKNNEGKFEHKDKVLLTHYALFRSYAELDDKKQMKDEYSKLQDLKGKTIKGKKVSPLFSYEDIDAQFQLVMNQPKKAWLALQRSQVNYMNAREKLSHYRLRILSELALDNHKQALKYFDMMNSIPGGETLKKQCIQYLEGNHETRTKSRQ
jgi:hypothetical protein